MIKRIALIILIIAFSAPCLLSAPKKSSRRQPPAIRDGLMLDGLDGSISTKSGLWYFSVFEPLTDGRGSIKTGAAIEILPSSMLEKLAGAVSAESKSFRIWGKITQFQNKNYIYLSYYLPVREADEPDTEPDIADANEEKIIPDDVLALLRPKRTVNLAELKKPLSTESDAILSDRTGFLRRDGQDFYFDFDALGRNIDSLSLPLLRCQALENIQKQSLSAIPVRFKISAVITSYKGKNYMLLQRASRAYNHENFAR